MHFPCTAVPVEYCPYLTDASHSISDTIRNPCVSCPQHLISLTRLPFTIPHDSCPSHYSCGLVYALPQQFSATLIHCKTFVLTHHISRAFRVCTTKRSANPFRSVPTQCLTFPALAYPRLICTLGSNLIRHSTIPLSSTPFHSQSNQPLHCISTAVHLLTLPYRSVTCP